MSKHTPGPWRVGDAGTTVFGPPNGSPSPQVIASVRKTANVHVIAVAPELLAALRQAVDLCPCSIKERLSGHLTNCLAADWLEIIGRAEERE